MKGAASDAAPFALMRVDKAAAPTSVLLGHQPRGDPEACHATDFPRAETDLAREYHGSFDTRPTLTAMHAMVSHRLFTPGSRGTAP